MARRKKPQIINKPKEETPETPAKGLKKANTKTTQGSSRVKTNRYG